MHHKRQFCSKAEWLHYRTLGLTGNPLFSNFN